MLLPLSFSNNVSFGGVYPSLVSALRAQGVFVSGLYVLCSSSWRWRARDHPGSLPKTSSVGFLALRSGRCCSGCCALWSVSLSPFPGLLAFDFPPFLSFTRDASGRFGGGAVSLLPRVSNAVLLHSAVSCPGGRLPSRFFLPLSRQSKVLRFIIIIIFIFQRR